MKEEKYEYFMKKCFQLAKKAEGKTNPNPLVGAVVVKKGKIISSGYHRAPGFAHAEVLAIDRAKGSLRGATLYVNLEPCSTWGRTPPCTQKIIESGLKKVVVATRDPNPLHRGRGIQILKKQGIKVVEGVLEKEARFLNRVFFQHIQTKLPYVSLKLALSLDGRIADDFGDSKWISSPQLRFYFHEELRKKVDAILVGINTVMRDDPGLTARKSDNSLFKKQPLRIVLDTNFRISEKAKLVKDKSTSTLIVIGKGVTKIKKEKRFRNLGVEIFKTRLKNGKINLRTLLQYLYRKGVTHILVEGGAEVVSSFLEEKLAHEAYFVISDIILGGKNVFYKGKAFKLNKAIRLENLNYTLFFHNILIRGDLRYV